MVEQPFSPDAYSALEQRFREPARALLSRIYHPLVLLLAWLGVSPNLVSLLQIPIGLAIVLAIKPYPRLAFLLIMASIAVDGVDGAIARHLGRGLVEDILLKAWWQARGYVLGTWQVVASSRGPVTSDL